MSVFEERGKPEYPEKNLSVQIKGPTSPQVATSPAWGCIFNRASNRVTRMGSQIVQILGERKVWLLGFKNGRIRSKKKVVTERILALLI